MIHTNRDQRPKKYELQTADVADVIGSIVNDSRIRQVSRGYGNSGDPIGWMQFKVKVPPDGKYQFPFPPGHKYSQEDVVRVVEFIDTVRSGPHPDLRYTLKLDRWYCRADIPEVIKRCKKLVKKQTEGEITVKAAKPTKRKKIPA